MHFKEKFHVSFIAQSPLEKGLWPFQLSEGHIKIGLTIHSQE